MPITHRRSFLDKCSALKRGGVSLEIEPGRIVARGFADFGYEEFFVLESGELCSLFTGERSTLKPDSTESTFVVPDKEQLLEIIAGNKASVQRLEFVEERKWKLCLECDDGRLCELEGPAMEEVLVEGLMFIHGISDPEIKAPRKLITSKEL